MKILTGIDIPFVPFGGSPIICNDWYSNLPKDISVRFLALEPNKPEYRNWWSMDDLVLLDIPKRKTVEEFPEYVLQLKQVIEEQLLDYQPDVIHCQHLNFGFSRAVAELQNYRIPKIGICHGTDVQIASNSEFFLNNMRFIRSQMDLLLFPSRNMANDYFRFDPCDVPYSIIPHGIPDAAFQQTPTRGADPLRKNFEVLYAGRLSSFKGVDIILHTMRFLNDNIHLTIIGNEDEPGYKQKLLKIVEEHQLQDKVEFIEHIPRARLWEEFKNYDLIVFPSTTLECFSLTTIEAQAHGLIVAYHKNAGGIENTVGDSGIKVCPNTPENWAKLLEAISSRPEQFMQYQTLGYANAEHYRLSVVRDRFFEASKKLLHSQ